MGVAKVETKAGTCERPGGHFGGSVVLKGASSPEYLYLFLYKM